MQHGVYICVAADGGGMVVAPTGATGCTFSVPSNSAVPYVVGTPISFANQGPTGILVGPTGSDGMVLSTSGATGYRTLGPNGMATAVKLTTTGWLISGNGLT